MPWVEYWNDFMHGRTDKECEYVFYDELLDEEELKDCSESYISMVRRNSEKGCEFGWNVCKPLSDDLKNKLIKKYKNEIKYYIS